MKIERVLEILGGSVKYEVGDRVVLVRRPTDDPAEIRLKIGTKGTVRRLNTAYVLDLGVEWDQILGGHNLNQVITSNRGWNVSSNVVQLVTKKGESIE
jgi:hypothetical protein